MLGVNTEKIGEQINRLQAIKTTAETMEENVIAKGNTETKVSEARKYLEEIDQEMNTLIESTIALLTQTKTLYEEYSDDYVNKFTRE